jgi:hypothetical protein
MVSKTLRPCSQGDNPVGREANTASHTDCLIEAGGGQPTIGMSYRLSTQELRSTRIPERASTQAAATDLSGRNLTSHNSFALIDDDIIRARSLEMGVNPETFPMDKINYLKDM